ncbi:MAG: UvrD-helicase domain-containing protein [Peptoniphilaceae bacterium]|nr:UvrD-helicase domain-containing protein [Peptoniphilaceae bacterium]MDY6085128.1 UvrD-helicase domain-containing protein [Peptoniphilaceae bacterium]
MTIAYTDEQQKALEPERKSRIVSAQAGAGKTGILVERIIREVVDNGVGLDAMLIVTFTKKAAAEMKSRIRQGLSERLNAPDADRPRILGQLNLLASANIQTLHAFCLEMLKEHFDRLDRDPGSTILSGRELVRLSEEAMESVFTDAYTTALHDPDAPLSDFLLRYRDASGASHQTLKAMIRQWAELAWAEVDPTAWGEAQVSAYDVKGDAFNEMAWRELIWTRVEDVQAHLDRARAALSSDFPETVRQFYEREIADLTHLLWGSAEVPPAAAIDLTESMARWQRHGFRYDFPRRAGVRKRDASSELLEASEMLAKERDAWKAEVLDMQDVVVLLDRAHFYAENEMLKRDLSFVHALATQYMERFLQLKRDAGGMDFNDVEHEMLRLLAFPDVVRELRERYALIFFDEYQDANAIQEAIVEKMAHPDGLFFVGDVKQSIYGFRQALPENFIRRYRAYREKANTEAIDLTYNFRSEPEILDFVNAVFSKLMTEKRGGVAYDSDAHRSRTQREATGAGRAEVVILEEEETESEKAPGVFDEISSEAFYVADAILAHVSAGGSYKDCAVLAHSSKRFRDFEAVFQLAGIPYYNDKATSTQDALETQMALHLLQCVENERADLPLLTSLLSLVGGFQEEDLAMLRIAHPDGPFYEAFLAAADDEQPSDVPDALRAKVQQFLTWRRDWKRRRAEMPLSHWMDAFFSESGFYTYLAGMTDGAARRRNVDLLVRLAEAFESRGGSDLMTFIDEVQRKGEGGEDLSPASALSESDDVVRLMTIHAAKGLQFPVVFLVDANKAFNLSDRNAPLISVKDVATAMTLRSWDDRHQRLVATTPVVKMLLQKQMEEASRAEEVRVLYVAMTRAISRLVIVGHTQDAQKLMTTGPLQKQLDDDHSELAWVVHALQAQPSGDALIEVLSGSEVRSRVAQGQRGESTEGVALSEALLKRRLGYRYPHPEATRQPLKRTVSQLSKKNQILDDHFRAWPRWEEAPAEERPIAAPADVLAHFPLPAFLQEEVVDAQTFGTLMHRALQNLPLREQTRESIAEELDAMRARELFTEAERAALDEGLLLRFFRSGLGKAVVRHADAVTRERSFTLRLPTEEGFLAVDGQVDLFLELEHEVVLVDFKTDRRPDPERYRLQLELYARAIALATHKPVTHCYLYWLRTGTADELIRRSEETVS